MHKGVLFTAQAVRLTYGNLVTEALFCRSRIACSSCFCRPHAGLSFVSCAARSISTTSQYWKKRSPEVKPKEVKKKKEVVEVWRNITVQELAQQLKQPTGAVIEMLSYTPNGSAYDRGSMEIEDRVVLASVIKKFGFSMLTIRKPGTEVLREEKNPDVTSMPIRTKDLAPRPPVVTIMGHVDHGKTTLLDALRHSNIVATEAGGITQAIGAFQVQLEGKFVTFIDTPGHAAFYAMRNRGAHSTDIVVLVVAADDGVMEQTKESIRMAQDAKVPIIVAINKIDRKDADVERTKRMLLQEGIQLEDFGGDIMSVAVSALKGTNLDGLVEAILTQAELMGLQAEKQGHIEGVVLESTVDSGRGKSCSILVQRGLLSKSAILVAGRAWGKVRNLFDENGKMINKAGPSTPVQVIGWKDLPGAGDKVFEVESEQQAKQIIEYRHTLEMSEKQIRDQEAIKLKLEEWQKEYKERLQLRQQIGWYRVRRQGPREKEYKEDTSGVPQLNVVVKGDVDGSVESFLDVLDTYDCHHQCRLDVVQYGVGDVTENDVKIAEAFKAHIYGFNIKMPAKLEAECEKLGIEFRHSKIIYRLVEALKKDLEQKLLPKSVPEIVGEANVLQVFVVTEGKKKLPVCGSKCVKGTLRKDCKFKLFRDNEELYDGTTYSMRHLKNEVNSISANVECGICLSDLEIMPKEGDRLVCYKLVDIPQKTEWHPVGF